MGTDKIKPRHLSENFELPLNKLKEMPMAEDVSAFPISHTHILSDVGIKPLKK